MNVKRTSYFTFLVAITTLAAATSCNKVKGQIPGNNDITAGEYASGKHQELFDICLEGFGKLDYRFELAKVLGDKGLKAGKFRLAIDPSGTLSVYLVIDKDYKGPVSAKIFDSKSLEYGNIASLSKKQISLLRFAGPSADERSGIAIRNRILRE